MQKIFFILGRAGLGGVFMYFGITSILEPGTFSRLVPDFISNIISANTVVFIHGIIETVFGVFLAFGLFKKIPSIVLAIMIMPTILAVTGFTRVRDFGILSALLILLSIPAKNLTHEPQTKITM